jgi:hypothetical protein
MYLTQSISTAPLDFLTGKWEPWRQSRDIPNSISSVQTEVAAVSIVKDQAQRIALQYVKSKEAEMGCELMLIEESTMERDFGWVFFYDSKDHIETGDFSHAIAGNVPIVLTRSDGALHETGTSLPLDSYLEQFSAHQQQ